MSKLTYLGLIKPSHCLKPMYPLRLAVQYDLWRGGISGSCFFENKDGTIITYNGGFYRTIITDFFVSTLHGIDVNNIWFQQVSATFHKSFATMDLLCQTFDGRLIRWKDGISHSTHIILDLEKWLAGILVGKVAPFYITEPSSLILFSIFFFGFMITSPNITKLKSEPTFRFTHVKSCFSVSTTYMQIKNIRLKILDFSCGGCSCDFLLVTCLFNRKKTLLSILILDRDT